MKRFVCALAVWLVLNCVVQFGMLPADGSLRAAAASGSDSVVVQDMYDYMDNLLSFELLETNKQGQQYREFSGAEDAYQLIDAYVQTICSGSYNLELVDSHFQDYGSQYFFSYAIRYTGSAPVSDEKLEMTFEDDVYGDVIIWGSTKRGRCSGSINIVKGLEFGDLGLRAGGGQVSTDLPGQSLYADLYLMSDGSFQTGDGRFHVRVGEAMVYSDADLYTAPATLVRNEGKNREELRIYNFYRNDSILLTLPYNSVLTGDILDQRALGINEDGGYEDYIWEMEDFLDWRFSDKMLAVCHGGEYLFCYRDDYNDFDEAVVRVMYWDPAQDVAVFYIYASFDSQPYVYEAVAAVSMGGTPEGADADEVFRMNAGEQLDITFSDTEYMPTHEIYTWEILEGSSLIELSNTRSQTCTVKAHESGSVRLKVTYEYGEEGQNVLTGHSETQFRSKSREYVIHISP